MVLVNQPLILGLLCVSQVSDEDKSKRAGKRGEEKRREEKTGEEKRGEKTGEEKRRKE